MSFKSISQISKLFHEKRHFCTHKRKEKKVKNYIFKTNQKINLHFYNRYAPLLNGGIILDSPPPPLFSVQAEGNVFKLVNSLNQLRTLITKSFSKTLNLISMIGLTNHGMFESVKRKSIQRKWRAIKDLASFRCRWYLLNYWVLSRFDCVSLNMHILSFCKLKKNNQKTKTFEKSPPQNPLIHLPLTKNPAHPLPPPTPPKNPIKHYNFYWNPFVVG